jgi:hypothetical protein
MAVYEKPFRRDRIGHTQRARAETAHDHPGDLDGEVVPL